MNPPTTGANDGADDAARAGHERLLWHQELVCPGPTCRGRRRVFPPGRLIENGRRERRCCPVCRTAVQVPAFYRPTAPDHPPDHREARGSRQGDIAPSPGWRPPTR